MGDGLRSKDEGVYHAHRPRGGLLQKTHSLFMAQDFMVPDQSSVIPEFVMDPTPVKFELPLLVSHAFIVLL